MCKQWNGPFVISSVDRLSFCVCEWRGGKGAGRKRKREGYYLTLLALSSLGEGAKRATTIYLQLNAFSWVVESR